jgi:hypothetical protein
MLMSEIEEEREVDESGKVLRCGECSKSKAIGDMGFIECYRNKLIRHKNSFCQIGEGQ